MRFSIVMGLCGAALAGMPADTVCATAEPRRAVQDLPSIPPLVAHPHMQPPEEIVAADLMQTLPCLRPEGE